jgi:hypothetical protein
VPTRDEKLNQLVQHYGDAPSDYERHVKQELGPFGDSYGENLVSTQRKINYNDTAKHSAKNLFKLLSKNAKSSLRYGQDAFPSISYDANKNAFSNSPHLSNTLNTLCGFPNDKSNAGKPLQALSRSEITSDFNGVTTHPCMTTEDGGAVESDYLKYQPLDMSRIKTPGLTSRGMTGCTGPKCLDCLECQLHQKELKKALTGIYGADDDTRITHVKNLVSTLNNWAQHHDARGGDKDTCQEPGYRGCNYQHQVMSTNLRLMANKINNAMEQDHAESNGVGGGLHRDNLIGDNKVSY